MYQNLNQYLTEFVSKYLVYQQVKTEYQRALGLIQSLLIPKWNREKIIMDFVMVLPHILRLAIRYG